MFSSFLDSNNKLLVNRLARAQATILGLSLSTKEEYLAQITSLVNAVINNGYTMQPLIKIAGETPGVVGDPITNLGRLNNDAADIAAEIDRLEDDASTLFNLSAASVNAIVQKIREAIYASSYRNYREEFINKGQIDLVTTSTVDFVSGVAQLPLTTETVLTPTLFVGQNSVGSSTDDISMLASATSETIFSWTGSTLEIIVSFATPTIVNRIKIGPDAYVGYEVTTITASADGSLFEDILKDIGTSAVVLDASAGKYTGASVIDFPPRSVAKMRLVIENLTTRPSIGLRSLTFTQRSYQSTGTIQSRAQTLPTGTVHFKAATLEYPPYVSITHQISGDSVHYTTIQPGQVTLPPQWWYRALFNRSSQAFVSNSAAVAANTADPAVSSGFTLVTSTAVPLDPTTIERTLVFSGISTAIPLAETPLPGTLQVSEGTLYLPSTSFSLDAENNLTILDPTGTLTVTYETSAKGVQNTAALATFYTPILTSFSFEAS